MTIRILVNGATGKMGQQVVKTIAGFPSDFTLVGATGKTDDLASEIKKTQPQVVIDFTNASVVYQNIQTIIDAGAHPVIGTTGLVKDRVVEFQKQCEKRKLGGIIAPNFSIGAVLMMRYAQEMVKYFPDVEIIEMHHSGKLDSPSGTAIRTAELLATARMNSPFKPEQIHETLPGARGATLEQIPIHAVRLPGLVAHQMIMFGGLGETLTIRHDAIDRQCFMSGVVFACKKVLEIDHLVFGLEHLL